MTRIRSVYMRLLVASVLVVLVPTFAASQSLDSLTLARNLGSVLAAEEFCGLTYDQDAIAGWIDENTAPSDMSFASTLRLMTDGAAYDLRDMSDSSRTAHCRAIERTARHFGFVK